MIVMFEVSGPFRARPHVERYPVLWRFIWGWFAVAFFRCGINDLKHTFAVDYANGEFEIPPQFRRYLKWQALQPIDSCNDPVSGVANYICRDGSGKTWIGWFGRVSFGSQQAADEYTQRAYPDGGGFEGPEGCVPARINGLWYWIKETP